MPLALGYSARPRRWGTGLGVELGRLSLGRDAPDVASESEPLERADDPAARIDLPPAQAVKGRGGEGVVVVVPRLAERQRRQPGEVARLVGGAEPAPAEEVAQRVDGEGDVVEQEDAHEAAPEQRGQRG